MRSSSQLLSTLLFLTPSLSIFANAAEAYEWPAGVDPSVKYWPPGTGPPSKRWLADIAEVHKNSNSSSRYGEEETEGICGVRKMSAADEGEKFLMEYWNWGPSSGKASLQQAFGMSFSGSDSEKLSNEFKPPNRHILDAKWNSWGFMGLGKRQNNFQCTSGTYSCTAIGKPASCCNTDETCEKITDTGYGDVGCCPNGSTCKGSLSGCGTDKVTCSRSQGGGCCISGTVCSPNGCVPENRNSSPTTNVPSPTVSGCPNGSYSCPSNVAGGCCPSGRFCGISDCPLPSSTTNEAGSPVASGDTCPTGYYTCAPAFNGGCCRIGRDCGITNCPERASGGATQTGGQGAVPTGQGGCANGWLTCAPGVGGGCCPVGYACGVTNCPARTIRGPGPVVSGSPLTTPVVLPETAKQQATASPIVGAAAQRYFGGVREVVVVVGVVVGVVAAV